MQVQQGSGWEPRFARNDCPQLNQSNYIILLHYQYFHQGKGAKMQ